MGAGAVERDMAPAPQSGLFPCIGDHRTVARDPLDGAGVGVERAGEVVDAPVGALPPIVIVLVGEVAQAVIGACDRHVGTEADKIFVAVADHQVAGSGIHQDLFVAASSDDPPSRPMPPEPIPIRARTLCRRR